MPKLGKLFGVGGGPGDPELISLKAVKVLNSVSVVYCASSTKNSYSLAREIVSPHLRRGVPLVRLYFPMTHEKKRLQEAWCRNAYEIFQTLKDGNDAAFVTLGDPMIYSTFGYIMYALKEIAPEVEISIIPGISSFQAAAAATKCVLAEAEESFAVISGTRGAEKLREVTEFADRVIMLKVYKHYKEILKTLKRLNLSNNSVLVIRCGLKDEKIIRELESFSDATPPYLSLLIIKKERLKGKAAKYRKDEEKDLSTVNNRFVSIPELIQRRSFEIIDAEVPEPRPFSGRKWQIVRRMIHTSGDFDLLSKVRFHEKAIDAGIEAIKRGSYVITDTKMLLSGINKQRLKRYGCKIRCFISKKQVKELAKREGITRAWASVDLALPYINGSIYAIGNSPTALIRLMDLIEKDICKPALIIGMPVGFVNAKEAKERLIGQKKVPYIAVSGRKGGSSLAAAVINQLLEFLESE